MEWIEGIREAIDYIEKHITEELRIEDIAKQAFISPFYFQKGFSMLCGFTLGEYIRQRRLTLAGIELVSTENKVIDIALKYGYDSPDSFTKAFIRFHGTTPTAVRKNGVLAKSFAPVKIKFTLEGGNVMDYKIIEKEAFTVMGVAKTFKYEEAKEKIPEFWTEHFQTGKGEIVCGMYGINIDVSMGNDEFEYLIADDYAPWKEIPEGVEARTIPKNTWAVFPCKGAMSKSFQALNEKIFSEWLPNCRDYGIAAGYNIELYTNADDYPNGTEDENYYSEIWIPIRRK